MELIQLTSDYEMKPFDCGDSALNGFKKQTSTKDQGDTQAMYFDILSVLEP